MLRLDGQTHSWIFLKPAAPGFVSDSTDILGIGSEQWLHQIAVVDGDLSKQ